MTTTLRLIIVLCHGFVHYTLSCMESRGTVDVVKFCPRNRSEWFQASQRKNCSSIQHSCESFVYHCVINPFVNELLEVCAPRRNILGKGCAEYNYEGGLVQYNRLASCVNHTVPCEFGYSSDEAYKYQECYKLVPLNNASSKTTTSRNENKISSNMPTNEEHYSSTSKPHFMERCKVHSSSVELGICLGVAVTTAVIEAIVFCSCWRRMKLQNETKDPTYTAVQLEDLGTSNERDRENFENGTASNTSNISRNERDRENFENGTASNTSIISRNERDRKNFENGTASNIPNIGRNERDRENFENGTASNTSIRNWETVILFQCKVVKNKTLKGHDTYLIMTENGTLKVKAIEQERNTSLNQPYF